MLPGQRDWDRETGSIQLEICNADPVSPFSIPCFVYFAPYFAAGDTKQVKA